MNQPARVGIITRNFPSKGAAKVFQNVLQNRFTTVKLLLKPKYFGFGRYQWAVSGKRR